MTGLSPRGFLSLTAALPLRVVVGALKGASINAALRQQEKPYNRPDGRGNAIPLWWLAPPPFPRKRGHYKALLCCELLMKGLLFRALCFPLHRGKSGAAGKGGGERSEPIRRMLFMPYDTESKSRNADFISIAAERQYRNPRGQRPRQTYEPSGPQAGQS